MEGMWLAAAYAYATQSSGACSLDDSVFAAMNHYLLGQSDGENMGELLNKFKKASFFYRLIALAHGTADPFNLEVVESYWLGGPLLRGISNTVVHTMALNDFTGWNIAFQKECQDILSLIISHGAKPHHNLQVYISYANGAMSISGEALTRLQTGCDDCRVCHGYVIGFTADEVVVEYQPLVFLEPMILVGSIRQKTIKRGFLSRIKHGDAVSFHLNMGIQILSSSQLEQLRTYNAFALETMNLRRR